MSKGRSRGSEPYGHVKTPVEHKPSSKDIHRAEASGRAPQGLGSAGRAGGSKSSGGKGTSPKGGRQGGGNKGSPR